MKTHTINFIKNWNHALVYTKKIQSCQIQKYLSRKRFYIPDLVDGDKINLSNDYSLMATAVSITVLNIKREKISRE